MVITNIETQKHNKDKVNIFIDGEYSFSLLTKECGDNYLYVGKELSEFEIHKLKNNNQKELAVNEIVNILSYGMKTEYELRKKLEEKGFDEEAITYAISKGIQHNYIDDEKYANCYIKERAIPNKWGSNKVFYLLQQKGIDKCIIQNAIDNLMSEDVLYDDIYNCALKKYNQLDKNKYNYLQCKQKIISYLINKGYSYNIVKKVVDTLIFNLNN